MCYNEVCARSGDYMMVLRESATSGQDSDRTLPSQQVMHYYLPCVCVRVCACACMPAGRGGWVDGCVRVCMCVCLPSCNIQKDCTVFKSTIIQFAFEIMNISCINYFCFKVIS